MSTKIYNGFRLPKMEMTELLTFSQKVKEQCQKIKTEKYHRAFADMVTAILDNINGGYSEKSLYMEEIGVNKYVPDNVFSHVYWDIYQRIKDMKATRERDPAVDFGSEVLFIPQDDCILALFYAENREFTKCWKSFKEVEDYSYWNQTDRPRKITVKDWQKRSDDWDKALGGDGYGIPGDYGFLYTLTSPDIRTPRPEEIIKYIPSFNKRLDRVVHDLYTLNKMKEAVAHLPKEEQSKWSNMADSYYYTRQAIVNGTVKNELEELKLKIEPLLHKKITPEVLREKIFKKEDLIETTTI